VVGVEVFNAGRSKIRSFLRDAMGRKELPAVEAPPESIRALVQRIASYQSAERPAPRAFAEWRSRIASPPQGTKTPGELAREALAEDPGSTAPAAACERAIGLVRDQSVGPWPPPREILEKLAERLKEVGSGVVIVSAAARQENVAAALREAVEEIFEPDVGGRTAERYEETAYVFWRRDQLEDARACLAAAAAFRERGSEGMEIGQAMLEVTLAPLLESIAREPEGAGKPDDASLVSP
jgi:hypothetical protein